MKKILTLIIGLLASGVILPATANAGGIRIGHSSIYVSGHHQCGCAIRTKRVVIGFDCYHRPIYRYNNVASKHHCRHYQKPRYEKRYYRNHYERRRYEQRRGRNYQRGQRHYQRQ